MIDNKLRDDMMFLYGNLDAVVWASLEEIAINSQMAECMKEQYESILERLFGDFK